MKQQIGHSHGPGGDHGHSHGGAPPAAAAASKVADDNDDDMDKEDEEDLEDKPFVWKDTEPEDTTADDVKAPDVEMKSDTVDEKLHVTPDLDKEVTMEAEEEADTVKAKAQELLSEGKADEALPHFIKAAELNPTAINYACMERLIILSDLFASDISADPTSVLTCS